MRRNRHHSKVSRIKRVLPYIKRGMYILLFVLLCLELFNVYSQYFLSRKTESTYQQPLSEEEPANVNIEEIEQNRTDPNFTPRPTEEWGKAKQIDEHTWTIKVGEDKHMGTPEEILTALNVYRQRHGSSPLQPDEKLTTYAQDRADFFALTKSTDKHAGFTKFVNEENGFDELKFNALGENSSYGFHVEGVHLIEWVYAGDEPHNKNQLNPEWTHVGIGVNGTATNLIFGGKKQ